MNANNQSSIKILELFVQQIRYEGRNIQSYVLVSPDSGELPAFTAGAHIDVHLSHGVIRQYSLCNSPLERHRYVIAVLRDEKGRGGSTAVHEELRVQDLVCVSVPRNNFELARDAKKVILLAGGIGVTPLKAMAHQLEACGVEYALHYCARDVGAVAFNAEFGPLLERKKLQLHFDNGDPSQGLDIERLLKDKPPAGVHLYYCGPAGFMSACAKATAHWPKDVVHFEHFKVPERPVDETRDGDATDQGAFIVEIASDGRRLPVSSSQSIVEVLRHAGIALDTSCEAGLCATCKIRYISGEVDHRDCILSEEEQKGFLTACVSRAKNGVLVLDL